MKELTERDLAWRDGFECAVAFIVRRLAENGVDDVDIFKLASDLGSLRAWNSFDEWRDLVERNCVIKEDINT